MDSRQTKEAARQAARERRARLGREIANWPDRAAAWLDQALAGWEAPCFVAGYHPVRGEADVLPLLARLASRGLVTALPGIAAPGHPLRFRRWSVGDPTVTGHLGIREPGPERPEVRPDVVLVPLLAFDRIGGRLGYGAGYYDRTLAALRADGARLCSIGLGYSGQELPQVPTDALDQRLDWIVTEAEAIRCGPAD